MAKQTEEQARLADLQAARAETLAEIADLDGQLSDLEAKRQELLAEAGSHDAKRRLGAAVPELTAAINTASSLRQVRKVLKQRVTSIDGQIEMALAELHRAEAHKGHLHERAHFEGDTLPKLQAALDSLEALAEIQRTEIRAYHGNSRVTISGDLAQWLTPTIKNGPIALEKWSDWKAA